MLVKVKELLFNQGDINSVTQKNKKKTKLIKDGGA